MARDKIFNQSKIVKKQTAQDFQDEVFRKMTVAQKLQLTWKFSAFLQKLNQLNQKDGIHGIFSKNSSHSGKARS